MNWTPKVTATVLSTFAVAAAAVSAAGTAAADPTPPASSSYTEPPTAIAAAVAKASGTCKQITAPTLTGLLFVQSGFDSTAKGPSGTTGVAQLFDKDFATYGADDNGDGHADITDPLESTMALSRLLCHIATEVDAERPADPGYPGSKDALAAYLTKFNAGSTDPAAVRASKDFVDQVTKAADHYASITPATSAATSTADAARGTR